MDAKTLTRKLAKDHTKMFARTLAKKLAEDKNRLGFTHTDSKNKTGTKSSERKDRTEDGENKDHNRVFVRTLAGKLAKDLAKRLAKNHTGKAVTNGGDYPHDDSHHGTNVKTKTDGNIHNGKAVSCDYAARQAAPSEGLDKEEQERQVVDNGKDIQHM